MHIRAHTHSHKHTYTQTYTYINTLVKRYICIHSYIYVCTQTYETSCVCQIGHRFYLGISRPHENTQTARIYMSRNWWHRGLIESSPDPVLVGSQWDGIGYCKVNLNNRGT